MVEFLKKPIRNSDGDLLPEFQEPNCDVLFLLEICPDQEIRPAIHENDPFMQYLKPYLPNPEDSEPDDTSTESDNIHLEPESWSRLKLFAERWDKQYKHRIQQEKEEVEKRLQQLRICDNPIRYLQRYNDYENSSHLASIMASQFVQLPTSGVMIGDRGRKSEESSLAYTKTKMCVF
jgi:hypothetical protein